MNTTVIKSSRLKQLLFLLGSILFVVGGFWLFKDAESLAASSTRALLKSPLFVRTVGLLGIVFFGFCAFVILKQMMFNKGGITLTAESFVNEISLPGIPVYWKDITAINTIQIHRTKLLTVMVQNPEEYLERQQSSWKRKLMKMNFNTYGTPIWISTNTLQLKHEEVVRLLNEYWQQSKSI